jgi:catechol 2,3-dioxygenase-like lactoylglutathione lyase family enzyme
MPNLENLRKQAKQILRWRRERPHTAAALIRSFLPGCEGLSDREILDRPFRLADAQLVAARRAGFESWQALKQGSPPMAETEKPVTYPAQPVLMNAEPTVFVTDFQRSLDFFVGKLGFKVAFTYGEPAFFGQVVRDAAMIAVRFVHAPVIDRSREPDLISASIWVSDARQLFLEFQGRGAPFRQTLRREPWHGQGQGSFIVEDPDGNLIGFGGRTD